MSDPTSNDDLKAQVAALTALVQQLSSGMQKIDSISSTVLAVSAKQDEILAAVSDVGRSQTGVASLISEAMNKLDSIESSVLGFQQTEQKDGLA